jgi:tRNA pseudouridine13 synthase
VPHRHKLRTGHLGGNRFVIRVRGVSAPAEDRARSALEGIAQRGLPNRFGQQRFGRAGRNVDEARALLVGGRGPRDRRAARFLLSALQSDVFNRVLAARPTEVDELELGDVAQVVASGGLFVVDDVALASERAARFEISPTGPIFGSKMKQPAGAPAEREQRILADAGIPPSTEWRLPRGLRLPGARRALRVAVDDATLHRCDEDLELSFGLPPGSYATVLLEELFGDLVDASRPSAERPLPAAGR